MKSGIKKTGNIIYRFIRNKYLFSVVFFVLWVLFFDTYNLIDRSRKLKNLKQLREEKAFFQQELYTYKRQLTELFSDKSQLEKFAREQYLMKKPNEDIFVVIEENED